MSIWGLCRVSMLIISIVVTAFTVQAAEMKLAVTTSFHNSGLSDILVPEIKKDLDLDVYLVVVGTGQALRLGKAGDVDAVLVHSRKAEEAFLSEGYGTSRREIMYNDFVLIGPSQDPADIASSSNAGEAFKKIEAAKAIFVSRGDDSGTHRKEIALWESTGFDVNQFNPVWYRASGSGMGATLNVAAGSNGYVLSDRATWLKFGNKANLKLLFSGDPELYNQYAYLRLNPARHPHVKHNEAQALEDWLTSDNGQLMIGEYKIAEERLFMPNARKPEPVN